jgi:DNA-binding SARP family transcriptional activator
MFDTRKSVALLALLAVARRAQSRDTVSAMLWPESDDAHARSSLRRTLSVTAAAVGGALLTSRASIELDGASAWCDLWEFERLAAAGDRPSLASAAGLYRDDFLSGFRARAGAEFDHWQELVAEELRLRLGRALETLVELEAKAAELDGALVHARRWLSLDELHEPAHRAVMRLLSWAGQRSAALEQYRRCVRVLDEELGVAPLDETTALYELIRADRLSPPPRDCGGTRDGLAPSTQQPAPHLPSQVPVPSQEAVVGSVAAELARARSGGRVAVVAGPAGSGKSWVVDALRHRARDGSAWIQARCHEGERSLELGCATELLRAAFASRPALRDDMSDSDVREVSRLVPDLVGAHDPAPPLESPGAQVRFFRAVGTALAAAAGSAEPGIVVVEDVQYVDDTSARLLSYLLRRLGDIAALVVLTWQDDADVPPALAAALGDAASAGRLTRDDLPPFERNDVVSLLAARGVADVDVDAFLEQTRGLPLLVTAYADAVAKARAEGGAPGSDLMPTSARHLFADRLARVSQATGQVVSAAAVLGTVFDAGLLRATSGRSSSEVADALDDALSRGLLVERGQTGGETHTYEFRYEGLRRVAYDTCGAARRRLLHGRAADALAHRAETTSTGELSASVAAHLAAAGRTDEAAAWSWRAAGRAIALFAHAEALDHLRRALELGYPPAEGHDAIADALIALGRYREARAELEKAAASVDPHDPALAAFAAGVEHRLASVHGRLGNWPVAAAHIEAARDLARSDPVVMARIAADAAFVAFQCGEPGAQKLALRAMDEAQEVGDARALAQAYNVAGMLAAAGGDVREAEAHLRTSLEVAAGDHEPAAVVAALNNLAGVLYRAGRTDDAIEAAETALQRGVDHGDVHRVAALHSNLADLLHAAGRGDESIAHLKEAAVRFASVDTGDEASPGIWTLTRW